MKIKYLITWKCYGGDNTQDTYPAEVLNLTDTELKEYVEKLNSYHSVGEVKVQFICIVV